MLIKDIEVPKEFSINNEDDDEDDPTNKEDTWNDLGLEKFNIDLNNQAAITATSIQK